MPPEASLKKYITYFDQALDRRWMGESSHRDKQRLVQAMNGFYKLVERIENDKQPVDLAQYIILGSRQAADLSERLQAWSMEQVIQSDEQLENLYARVQTQLNKRTVGKQLLKGTQQIFSQTQQVAYDYGLGMIL